MGLINFRGRRRGPRAGQQSISRGDSKRKGRIFLRLFFAFFFVIGSVVTYVTLIGPLLGVYAARDWITTPCTIVSSNVESHSDSDGTTYSVAITYRYQVRGTTYTSDRYSFVTGSSSGRSGKAAVVAKYPAGSDARCYVDPDDPSEAVIQRGLTAGMAFGAIPLVFVIIGLLGFIFAGRMTGYRPRVADPEGKANYLPDERRHAAARTGHVVLTSAGGRVKKTLMISGFALLWNGIVWTLMYFVVLSDDDAPLMAQLFIGLFALIGVGLLGLVGWSALAIFNPTVRLELAGETFHLGEPLEVSWQVLGPTRRLQDFALVLEGIEEATYQRGTDTVTDTNTFVTYDLVRVAEPDARRLSAGDDARLDLPTDTMHSFEASRNKIRWQLKATGAIPRWPDIEDTFELTLLPARLS